MPRSILVVEDSPTQAERLRLLLEGAGYRVEVAASGREGLERVRLSPPDLIISDVVMPGMDGYALCHAVKSSDRTRKIPFVLLTERNTPLDVLKGLERGADNFITKPFEDDYLLERLRRIFEHLDHRRRGRMEMEVMLCLGERRITVNTDKQQIVELLFSTFEELCRLNDRLLASQRTIEEYARTLEARVEKRTRQVREAEARYRGIFENAVEGIYQSSPEGHFITANPALARILGYASPEELIASVTDIARQLYVDSARRQEIQRLLEEHGVAPGFEFQAYRRDGSVIWLSVNTRAVRDASGAVRHYEGTAEDITARKRAEEAARGLATVGRALVETLDLDQVTHRIASTVLRLFGAQRSIVYELAPATGDLVCVATAGGGDPTAWIGRSLPAGTGLAGRAVTQGRPVTSLDLLADARVTVPDWLAERVREEGYRSVVAVPLRTRGEAVGALVLVDMPGRAFTEEEVRLLAVFADQAAVAVANARLFGETQRALEELARTQDQLAQAQKMEAIGRLAGGIAHDFNNLLTVILGRSLMLLKQFGADDRLRRNVTLIHKTAERASALTRQLLAFGRKQVLQPRVLDLNAVVAGMAPMLHRLIGEDIELVTTLDSDLGRVDVDPSQLERVILNLAINAREAMPQGGRLTIETQNVELDESYARLHRGVTPGRYVMLAVSDTGIGMDAETQAHLFEPFFTTKGPGEGTGLGLATVYGIVKQTGGNIFVYSEPGRGATFKVYLPRVEEPAEPIGAPAPAAEAPRGSETILLVEDEEGLRDLAREILEGQGYTVLEARHPGQALLIGEHHAGPIHLLLTDVVMPGMNGRALADRLGAERPGLKVLYMSGYTDDAIVRHGVLEPGREFLQKPFTEESLARRVREALDAPERPAEGRPA